MTSELSAAAARGVSLLWWIEEIEPWLGKLMQVPMKRCVNSCKVSYLDFAARSECSPNMLPAATDWLKLTQRSASQPQ